MTYEYRPQESSWHCSRCGAEIATGSHCWNCDANDESDEKSEADANNADFRDGGYGKEPT